MMKSWTEVKSSKSTPEHKKIAAICRLSTSEIQQAINDYQEAYNKSGNEQLLEYIKLLKGCHKHKVSR